MTIISYSDAHAHIRWFDLVIYLISAGPRYVTDESDYLLLLRWTTTASRRRRR